MTDPVQASNRQWLAIFLGIIAAGFGAVLYMLTVRYLGLGQTVPALSVGPIVGFVMRLAANRTNKTTVITAGILTAMGCLGGFIWADYYVWTPFMLQRSLQRALSLQGIAVFAVSIYLACLIAQPRAERT